MKTMVKKALKSGVGVAIGTTIGGCVLPRLFFKGIYDETWPPIWQQAIVYFVVGYIAAFIVFYLIDLIKQKAKK